MKAIQVKQYGGPEVLELVEIDEPTTGAGQVKVDLDYSGVLWIDTILRTGQGPPGFTTTLPWIPGQGGAGVVREVGPSVTTGPGGFEESSSSDESSSSEDSWIGRRVLVDSPGSYAETVVAPVEKLVPIPDGLASDQAIGLLHDGGTALGLWETLGPAPEDLVLVQPAAGGAGAVLVQLAVQAGVPVIAAARGDAKLRLAASLGANHVVDYGQAGWDDWIIAETGRRPTVVFDGVGGELGAQAYRLVAAGGKRLNYGTASGRPTGDDGRTDVETTDMSILARLGAARRRRQLAILDLAAVGALRSPIFKQWPLARANEAHRALAGRSVVGKALLKI